MSPLTTRALVTAGAAALALGLTAPTAALADPGSDPAGNNGTIKIEPYGATDGHANHPHPGCDFRLQLFGFDDDQTGTITFVGQAPTKDAVTQQPLAGSRLLSDDAAHGGQDADAFFDVRGADLGLTGAPQAQQGYHVKVLVDADDAPGGAKTKVFWLDCPAPTEPADTAPEATTGSTGSTATADAPATEDAGTVAASGTSVAGTSDAAATVVQGATSGAATAAAGEAAPGLASPDLSAEDVTTFTGGSAAAVRSTGRPGAPVERGSALPFTGVPALGLLALGLGTLAAGGLAVVLGRRRTSEL